jgi:DNA mismatch repair protein MutL
LKFLKSISTENGHIANVVSQYALAYPGVAFTLSVDGRVTLHTSGKGRLLDTIIDVYGVETAGKMLPLDEAEDRWAGGGTSGEIHVSGMVATPEMGRSGRNYLSFFVNRRWVSSRLLAYAVEEAYHGLLMTGKHPVAVLNISLPPREIDVNIHPTKSEVKFRNESAVFRAVQSAVRRALVARMPVPKIEEIAAPYAGSSAKLQELWQSDAVAGRSETPLPGIRPAFTDSLPVLRIVGQVMEAYIVAEGPDGLYLIDQHAAHERVRFDILREQHARRDVEVQGLLEPLVFEVLPRQHGILESCLGQLESYGFNLEPFGERTYLVRSIPGLVAGDSWPEMLRELLDELSGEAKSSWQEKILASIACHGAVRSGQALSDDEMRGLVRQLEKTASPFTCPHGRPTVVRLTAAQLEKQFGRS